MRFADRKRLEGIDVIAYVKKFVLLAVTILITACSSSLKVLELPQVKTDSRFFVITQQFPRSEKSLLVIEVQSRQWRWVQTDPLGVPIARLVLSKAGWQNDGFVMPNKQAKQLFSAIATYFMSTMIFDVQQISDNEYAQNHQLIWRFSPQKNGVSIELGDKSVWFVEPLSLN